jgi:NifU-like protein
MSDATNASNEGPLPGANAIGESGSLDSGPGVRIALRVDVERTITAARFELRAFDAARACAAALCESVVGATVDDVDRTTARAVARLAGLSDGSAVARRVHFALRGALRAWVEPTARRGGEILCACFALERSEIVDVIRVNDLRTIEDVRARMPATRGCGTCLPDVEALLRAETGSSDDAPARPPNEAQ